MSSEPENLRKPRPWLLLGISVLVGGGFWWLLRRGGLPIVPSQEQIERIGVAGVAGYSSLWILTMWLKALRWHFQLELLAPVHWGRVFSASVVGFAAQLALPVKTGELVRPFLISRGTGVSFLAAMSTSATERIVDALFASSILILSLLNAEVLSPLPERIGSLPVPAKIVPTLGYGAAVVSLLAILLIGLFYAFHDAAQRIIAATIGRISPKVGTAVESRLAELAKGLNLVASPGNALKYFGVSALYWTAYLLGILFLLRASGFSDATLAHAGVLAGTLAFSFAVPNAPGFFGVFQVSIYAALAVFYSTDQVQDFGATAVFWLYVLQLGWVFLFAPIGGWVEHRNLSLARAGVAQ